MPEEVTLSSIVTLIVYGEMRGRIEEELQELIEDYEEPEEEEEEES